MSVRARVRVRLAKIYSPILEDRAWSSAAIRILCLNFVLVALSFAASDLWRRGVIDYYVGWWLSAYNDYAAAEVVGYIQMIAACWLMFRVFKVTRSPFDLALSGIAGFLMLDDLLSLHDQLRIVIGERMFSGTRFFTAEDLGEAVYSATAVTVVALLLISVGRRARSDDVIRGLPFVAAIVLLGFFAIGVDNVHQILALALPDQRDLGWFLANVEDGGELVAMGLMMIAASAQHRLLSASSSEEHHVAHSGPLDRSSPTRRTDCTGEVPSTSVPTSRAGSTSSSRG